MLNAELLYDQEKYGKLNVLFPDRIPSLGSQKNMKSFLISRFLSELKGKEIDYLDVGCGYGEFVFLTAPYVRSALGFDISQNAVRIAKSITKHLGQNNCEFRVHNASLPFELNQKFDLITCFDVLEHLIDPKHVITNILELLNPNGICVFTTGFYHRLNLRTIRYFFASMNDRQKLESWLAELKQNYGLDKKNELTIADAYAYHFHNFRDDFFRKIACEQSMKLSFLYKPAFLSEIWDFSRFVIKGILKKRKLDFHSCQQERMSSTVQLWPNPKGVFQKFKANFQFAIALLDCFLVGSIVKGPGGFIIYRK